MWWKGEAGRGKRNNDIERGGTRGENSQEEITGRMRSKTVNAIEKEQREREEKNSATSKERDERLGKQNE